MPFSQCEAAIRRGISDGIFPGAVALVANREKVLWQAALGHRMLIPEKAPMQQDTIFDLASLTKVVATTTLALQCIERGAMAIDTPVQEILPAFERKAITVRHLLTHTSGLPAWKALYLDPGDPEAVVSHLGALPLAYPTGTGVVYSCLGYILLGKLLETLTGESLDELARERICEPLGMQTTGYNPPASWQTRCAATEDSNSFERRQVRYQRYDWRDGIIIGEVHDENAHFLGGVSGNAGLFSTAADLGRFGQMLLRGGDAKYGTPHADNGTERAADCRRVRILNRESIAAMATLQTEGLDGRRGLGWILLEDGALYHTGFTGTAMRVDLGRGIVAVLLTNRVHPDASRTGIIAFRQEWFDLVGRSVS